MSERVRCRNESPIITVVVKKRRRDQKEQAKCIHTSR